MFVLPIFKISYFSNLDIGVKSSIFLQSTKFNSLIFLLFSKNNISEIFALPIAKISNFSNLDIGI